MTPLAQHDEKIAISCGLGLEMAQIEAFKESDTSFELEIEARVINTIKKYDLIEKDEKIVVAVSGGKDSTVLLYILKKSGYDVKAATVDAHIGCYTKENLQRIRQVCKILDVELHEISFRDHFGKSLCYIRSVLNSKGYKYKSCNICGVLRRYLLNTKCRELNATKIAMGHNMDDEAQVVLMNMLRGNNSVNARLGPKPGIVKDKKFIPRVKPLYFVSEEEVIKYSKLKGFPVYYGHCPCSLDSYRFSIKSMLNELGLSKENFIKSYLKMVEDLKKYYSKDTPLDYCGICSEPCRGKTCNACKLISEMSS